jgi:hypothetical protein
MRSWVLLFLSSACVYGESVAGLQWKAPAGWVNEGSRPMRAATYAIAAGGQEKTECVVYFFGKGQGGSVEANLERWKGQFHGPDGKPAEAAVRKRTLHGLPATTIDVSGEYSGGAGPGNDGKVVKQGYRLLGAIVEGPGGNVFIKFAGPAAVVAAQGAKFEELLASFEREGNMARLSARP